jgi:hypothetical protein
VFIFGKLIPGNFEFFYSFGANPAIRYNLLFFKEKNKRISTTIGAKNS